MAGHAVHAEHVRRPGKARTARQRSLSRYSLDDCAGCALSALRPGLAREQTTRLEDNDLGFQRQPSALMTPVSRFLSRYKKAMLFVVAQRPVQKDT